MRSAVGESRDTIETIFAAIETFCRQPRPQFSHRAHLNGDGFTIYARYSRRMIDRRQVWAFTIATVELKERKQGRGLFTRLLLRCEELVRDHDTLKAVVVESVVNPGLAKMLRRSNYALIVETPVPELGDYAKLIEKVNDGRTEGGLGRKEGQARGCLHDVDAAG